MKAHRLNILTNRMVYSEAVKGRNSTMVALLYVKKHHMKEHRLNILAVRIIYTEERKQKKFNNGYIFYT